MSLQEAADLLGVSTSATPSQVKDAYREKARESHPDRGGDLETMKKVNLAYEILTDKTTPSYDRSDVSDVYRPSTETKWAPPVEDVVTFRDAKSAANLPSGVEWLFGTTSQTQGYSSSEFQNETLSYVAFGMTDTKLVFALAVRRIQKESFVGGMKNSDKWQITSYDYPKGSPDALASTIVSRTQTILHQNGVKFNGKVLDIRGKEFTERAFSSLGSRSVAIKDWIANSGLVANDDATLSNRKVSVEYLYEKSLSEKPGFSKPLPNAMYDFERHTIIVNGREYILSHEDAKKVALTRFGGKTLIKAIFGDYTYDQSKKVVTRMAKAKVLLEWMSKLPSLPEEVQASIAAAAAQAKG